MGLTIQESFYSHDMTGFSIFFFLHPLVNRACPIARRIILWRLTALLYFTAISLLCFEVFYIILV